jgi:hypothetical protein
MNRLIAAVIIVAACFLSSLQGEAIGKQEAQRTGTGATVGVLIYAAIELLRNKEARE